jgi:hypothetical protein
MLWMRRLPCGLHLCLMTVNRQPHRQSKCDLYWCLDRRPQQPHHQFDHESHRRQLSPW